MPKARPQFRISLEHKPTLVCFDGFRVLLLRLVSAAQKAVVEPVVRIQVDGIA
jgi:hypothetical protein